jgi:GNAT superfamily N-acetyltransferase
MNFALTPQMLDKIGFAMEDQKERYAIDVETGELQPLSSLGQSFSEERFALLPRWGSAEGFHLMESFITTLRNPLHRDILAKALTSGTGVFRNFKDSLKKNKEIEKLWFQYKETRLKAIIVSWYNVHREARGLTKLPFEPEEHEELVESDFSFAWGERGHRQDILRLDREVFRELFSKETPAHIEARYAEKRRGVPGPGEEGSPILVAETPTGDLVGFAWGLIEGRSVHIVQLSVVAEMRGIGLGEALIKRFLTDMRIRGMKTLTMELAGKSLRFSPFFQSMGFRPITQILESTLDELPY